MDGGILTCDVAKHPIHTPIGTRRRDCLVKSRPETLTVAIWPSIVPIFVL
jgi:hypothetical protein